jgi:predicted anti-sigma-YlaC factor YlaD
MTDERCQQYLEDPEANAAHLAECDSCRMLADTLNEGRIDLAATVEPTALDPNALPLAPWEGASYRPWTLVLLLTGGTLALALIFCFAAGTSITKAVSSSAGSFDMIRDLVRMTGDAAPHAPTAWHIGIGVLFFVVNGLLVLLLRRAPRGIDA